MNKRRIRLRGRLKGSSSSVEIKEDGSLLVEFYDFGEEAQSAFGNDVAFLLTVAPRYRDMLCSRLSALIKEGTPVSSDEQILEVMQSKFADYYEVKEWLEHNDIPFEKNFDGMA